MITSINPATNLLKVIEDSLNEIIISHLDGDLTVDDVLKLLHESVHYKHPSYIYEMFFIQALRINKIPTPFILVQLPFRNMGVTEEHIYADDVVYHFDNGGTRRELLHRLNLKESLKLYDSFVESENYNYEELVDQIKKDLSKKS